MVTLRQIQPMTSVRPQSTFLSLIEKENGGLQPNVQGVDNPQSATRTGAAHVSFAASLQAQYGIKFGSNRKTGAVRIVEAPPPAPPPIFDDSALTTDETIVALTAAGHEEADIVHRLETRDSIVNTVAIARNREGAITALSEQGVDITQDAYARRILAERGEEDRSFGKAPTPPPAKGSPEEVLAKRAARVGDKETLLTDARKRADAATRGGKTAEATRILEKEIKPLQDETAFTREELEATIRVCLKREPTKVKTAVEMDLRDPLSRKHNPTESGRPGLYEFLAPDQEPGTSQYYYSPDIGNGGPCGGGSHGGGAYKVFNKSGTGGTFKYIGIADERGRIVMTPNRERLAVPIDPFS